MTKGHNATMDDRIEQTLKKFHSDGKLNDFMMNMVQKALPMLSPDMFQEVLDDAVLATSFDVNSKEDYNLFHYVDVFTDQLVEEIIGVPIGANQLDALKKFIYDQKGDLDFGDLASFRLAVLRWLKRNKDESTSSPSKLAYPNRNGMPVKLRENSVSKWAEMAVHVRKQISMGANEYAALVDTANYLPARERPDFIAWYKFRYGSNRIIYDVNQNIRDESEDTMSTLSGKSVRKTALFQENESKYYLPEPKPIEESPDPAHIFRETERQDQFKIYRDKLVARTFAIDKMLEKYRTLFSDKQVMEIEEALNNLRTKIRMLTYAESVLDSMIKTSAILKKHKFTAGSNYLLSMADEITGRKDIQKSAAELNLEGLQGVLNELYAISNYLKRRDIVRQIAGIDLKLHDMMISSFFPEISEAQSKLIDAFGYAANKLEDVMPKIRTSVNKPQDKEGPPQLSAVETNPEAIAEEQAISQSGKPSGKPTKAPPAQVPQAPNVPQQQPNPNAAAELAEKVNEG